MLFLLFFALLTGAFLPVQAGINASLRTSLGHPTVAALASFLVGTAGLFAWNLVSRAGLPGADTLGRVPAWQWTGGLIGAVYVLSAIVLAPRLGAATLIATVVAGQMIASLVLDHFGWVGYAQHAMNGWRLAGRS